MELLKQQIHFIYTILICLVIFAGPAWAQQADSPLASEIDPTISHIAKGGVWQQADKFGTVRVVVSTQDWEHTRSFVYLQWLEHDEARKETTVYKTIPIPELNESNWHNVSRIARSRNTISVYYTIRGQEGARRAIITPGLPGKYKINLKANE